MAGKGGGGEIQTSYFGAQTGWRQIATSGGNVQNHAHVGANFLGTPPSLLFARVSV